MNKKKRILIMSAAIVNIVCLCINLALAIVCSCVDPLPEWVAYAVYVMYSISIHSPTNLIYSVVCFAFGLAGSILLLWAVRDKGRHFRRSQGLYAIGFAFVVIFGGWIPWVLLLIQMFIPDVIVMNSRSEVRREERAEVIEAQNLEKERNRTIEEKKKKIDELKKLRDDGVISEEEYKQKLFEIL